MPSIAPYLWFSTDLAEPIELCGQQLMLLNGGPVHAGFNEAMSMFTSVDSQPEIDALWDKLVGDGGEPGRCGWLKDRYGRSWQIVPSMLGTWLGAPDRQRVQQATDAMLQMGKLDIATLQAAYDR